jgi:MFS family permease
VIGPVLGGVFAETAHWSLIFWINLPLGLLALRLTDRALRELPRHERPHQLDLLGAALIVAATICFLLALSWGGARYPWGSPQLLSLLGATTVLALLFAARLATAREPFLPLSVLREPVVRLGTATACCAMGTFIGLSIYVPVFFEAARGLTAAQSGVALIPLMSGVILGAVISARLMGKIQHYRRPPLAGLVLAMSGCVGLALHPSALPLAMVATLLTAVGAGIGTVLPVTTVAIQNAVPMHQLGTATGVMSFFRALGGAVAVAGFGALILGHADRAGSNALVGDLDLLFGRLFLTAAAGLVLAFLWLALMPERPLRDRIPPAGAGDHG